MKNLFSKSLLLVLAVAVFAACDTTQDPALYSGDEFVRFGSDNINLFVLDEREVFEIPISIVTDQVPTADQTYTFTIDEDASTAVSGVHYELSGNSVTIPAGSVATTLPLTAIKANLTERVTLVLTFGGDNFSQTTTIGIQNPVRDVMIGDYAYSYPWFYGTSDFFAQSIIAASDVSQVVAPGMLVPEFDITMDVIPTSDPNVLNVDVARQNAWVSANFGQAEAVAEELGTFEISSGELNLVLRHWVAAGTFGAHPLIMVKLPPEKAQVMKERPAPVVGFDFN